ncbi:MAG: helix-turn-helix domain-containing protein [Ruminococcus sp.]|nr:helix-turn-helix domain-containing protein [Ruminococcus sp.]
MSNYENTIKTNSESIPDVRKMTDFNVTYNESIPDMRGVKETAAHFGIAQHYARQLALTGKVKAVRCGCKILINQASVADYFNSNTLTTPEEQDGVITAILR